MPTGRHHTILPIKFIHINPILAKALHSAWKIAPPRGTGPSVIYTFWLNKAFV